MGRSVDGGNILAELILSDKKFNLGLKGALAKIGKFRAGFQNAIKSIGSGMDAVGGRMVEQAERFTFLAGAIFAPIVLSMKSFTAKGAEVQDRIKAISEELKAVPPFQFGKRQAMEAELARLQSIEIQTRAARQTQERLAFAFKALNFEIGKLLWGTLGEYLPRIITGVKATIAWIAANKALASKVVKVVAGFGTLMLVIAPVVTIMGKVIRVFAGVVQLIGLALSPVGLLVIALGGLYLLFKNQLDPIFEEHYAQLQLIWESWRSGSLSTEEAINRLGSAFGVLFKDIIVAVGNKINAKINEWTGGWINKLVEDGFYYIIHGLDLLKAAVTKTWDWVVDKFTWAGKQITNVMDKLRSVWDKAVGNSWWTDAMAKMAGSSQAGMGATVAAFTNGARAIQSSMGAIHGSLGTMGGVNLSAMRGITNGIMPGSIQSGAFKPNITINGPGARQFAGQLRGTMRRMWGEHLRKTVEAV